MTFPNTYSSDLSHGVYPLIDVSATIAHSERISGHNPERDFRLDKKTKKRVKELGLAALRKLFESSETHQFKNDQVESAVKKIEEVLIESAGKVKTKRFSRYDKNNVLEAIKFLELFSIYCAQKIAMHVWVDSIDHSSLSVESSEFFRYSRRSGGWKDFIEKNTFKAIGELEFLVNNHRILRDNKPLAKQHLKTLRVKIREIYTNNLSLAEQVTYAKPIDNALKILKSYY